MCARCKRLGSNCQFDPPNKGSLASRTLTAQTKTSPPPRGEFSRPLHMSPPVSPSYQRLLLKLPDEPRLDRILTAGFERPTIPIYTYRDGWDNSFEMGGIARNYLSEGYETCIPRVTIESAIRQWDVRYDPPPDVADYL